MILCDRDIIKYVGMGAITICPFSPDDVQPASVDVHLSSSFVRIDPESRSIDPLTKRDIVSWDVPFGETQVLLPGEFLLGSTLEEIGLPTPTPWCEDSLPSILGRIEGKSSIGRIGLFVHVTAGFVDPGFVGQLTLELYNATRSQIVLTPGMKIAQIAFQLMSGHPEKPYGPERGSHYKGQSGATASAGVSMSVIHS